ncbi:hypothetical protein F4677DRAFT_161893 [Hypoxylon crocopeplum]|nr:hypothetical protein F4677DRAFT_161893 [Hypoxylon crocopeplum]
MPPSNGRRQPQDTRLWTRSSKMDRRSTLHQRGSLGERDTRSDSFSNRILRPRLVFSRDRDGGDGDSGGRGGDHDGGDRNNGDHNGGDHDGERDGDRDFQKFGDGPNNAKFNGPDNGKFDGPDNGGKFEGPGKPGDGPGDDSDDGASDSGDDVDSDNDEPQQAIQPPAATTSGSIVTLTALPPSQATQPAQPAQPSQPDVVTVPVPQTQSPSLPVSPPATTANPPIQVLLPSTEMKEEGDSDTILPSSLTTDIQPTPTSTTLQMVTSTTSSISEKPSKDFSMDDDDNNNNNNNNNNGGKHRGHGGDKDSSRGGLDSTAEHLLIAAGAIGAFILFCFIGWIVYRVLKRSKGQGAGVSGGMGFIDKFSWRKKGQVDGTWDGRTLTMSNEAPPLYEKGEYGTLQPGTFYGPGKVYPAGPGSAVRSVASNSETGTLRQPLNNNPAHASIIDQYAPDNEAASVNNNVNLTLRSQMSQMSQPYYDESQIVRQPPDGYEQAKRPGNRASALSSISSGFGDGDIIIPPPLAVNKPLPSQGPPDNPAARESWMSREGSRRETVYTTTSEDRPARFRSISSWVNQQAGRAKRAGSRARERGEVPVIPAIPGEISMTQQTAYR